MVKHTYHAEFDKYHPIKKHRSAVENDLKPSIVYILYFSLFILGIAISLLVNTYFTIMMAWLWVMGVLYNVKPIRTKDVPYVDVLTESVNNAIRFLAGWFIVTDSYLPPVSIIIGYWFAGSFLMATKRFSEYCMINDPETASLYRKSFARYTKKSLLISSFFYAMLSVLFVGIFLIKYRVELILFIPFYIGLFCYYFYIAFKEDSAAQKPEKLYKEKGLFLYITAISIVFVILMLVDIPALSNLVDNKLIPLLFVR